MKTLIALLFVVFVSLAVPRGMQAQAQNYPGGGGSSFGTPPTTPTNVPYTATATNGTLGFSLPGLATRSVSGTTNTDTILATDCNPKRVAGQGTPTGGNLAVTLPTATTLGIANCVLRYANNQVTGRVTITPTTWNLITPLGGATATAQVLLFGQWVTLEPDPGGSSWDEDIGGPAGLESGTSVTLVAPSEIYVCTSTCTVTVPAPLPGYQFCIFNGDNVSTVITLAALGSSARYENTARTAYGTAGTGTFVSGGAVKDSVCLVGLDSTHYITTNFNGTWTAN